MQKSVTLLILSSSLDMGQTGTRKIMHLVINTFDPYQFDGKNTNDKCKIFG
jgi:hypothetical protein